MTDQTRYPGQRGNSPQARSGSPDGRFSRRPEDPLAELARLIGQDDPFAEITNEQPQQQQRASARSLATPLPRRPVNGNGGGNGAAHAYARTPVRDDLYDQYQAAADDYDRAPAADSYARQREEEPAYEYSLPVRRTAAPVNGRAYSYGGGQALRAEPQTPRMPRPAPQPQAQYEEEYEDDYAAEPQPQVQPQYGYQNGSGQNAPYRQARAPQAPAQYEDDQYEQDYQQEYGSEYEAEYAADGYEYEQEYAEPQRGRRWMLLGVMSLIGVIAIGVAGVYGYRALFKHHRTADNPPTIKSAEAPTKVAPTAAQATPDGTKQNYDRIGDQPPISGERVVSREEQPATFGANAPNPTAGNRVVAPSAQAAMGPGSSVSAFAAPAQNPVNVASPSSAPNLGGEPKRVRTISVRSDGSLVENGRRAQPAPARGTPLSLNPNAEQPQDEGDSRPVAQPQTRAGHAAGQQAYANTPSNYVPAGSYVVQVSSQKNEADAQTAWRQLQAKYTSVLGNAQVSFKRVDLGDRGTFYRAMVGPFANRDQAYEMCQNLKSAGGECVVQRN